MDIEELDRKFDEILKGLDKDLLDGWIRKKIDKEKEEQRKERNEQLKCVWCETNQRHEYIGICKECFDKHLR